MVRHSSLVSISVVWRIGSFRSLMVSFRLLSAAVILRGLLFERWTVRSTRCSRQSLRFWIEFVRHSERFQIVITWPNPAAPGNGAIASRCHAGRARRAVPEQRRSAARVYATDPRPEA